MTAQGSKTGKRLSSLFSLGRDESASTISQSSNSSQYYDAPSDPNPEFSLHSTPRSRLATHQRLSSSAMPLPPVNTALDALDPPPLVTAEGISRPRSRDASASRPVSVSSQEGSRSRPQTPVGLTPVTSTSRPGTPDSAKLGQKKSWLSMRPTKHAADQVSTAPKAWIAGLRGHIPYDLTALFNGHPVSDLWNENGDTLVYLFPRDTGRGASFKIHSSLLAAASTLLSLSQPTTAGAPPDHHSMEFDFQELSLHQSSRNLGKPNSRASFYNTGTSFSMPVNPNPVSQAENRLYIPLGLDHDYSDSNSRPRGDDIELLVLYRNFFAFLTGGALVSTPRQVSLYSIFVGISTILRRYRFENSENSTFGEAVSESFQRYCEELRLADVRTSREKTIEAIVLGESMRCWDLYHEGFVHAAGRLDDIKSIQSPKYAKVSATTANRLERANIDLEARLLTLRSRLEDFDFPSMFAGLARSQTAVESKIVRFKEWKVAFAAFKRHVLAHYRHKYGAWPPKAGSKKHNFEESGLNRLVLRDLYQDFCDLYDMLVDRSSMTTRTVDLVPLGDDAVHSGDVAEATRHALRRIEEEYDSSDVPVHPPIPFDVPLVPTFTQSFNRSHAVLVDDSAHSTRRLRENEVNEILLGSYNRESMKATSWIQDFITFERRMGTGKTLEDIVDLRTGQWLFIYAVLQSLPMTVIDARDLQFTEGVEYFLCMAPRGGRPWMKEDTSQSRAWYNVANGGAVVSLPADSVDHSTEGVYRRSHCWTVAAEWAQEPHNPSGLPQEPSPLPLPPPLGTSSPHISPHHSPFESPSQRPASGSGSPSLRPISPAHLERPQSGASNRSSVMLGLEATAPPPNVAPRPSSTYNPNVTFDSILGASQQGRKGKK